MSELDDAVFRSLRRKLLTSPDQLSYQDAMEVLEAIRILQETAATQAREIEELRGKARHIEAVLQVLGDTLGNKNRKLLRRILAALPDGAGN